MGGVLLSLGKKFLLRAFDYVKIKLKFTSGMENVRL